MDPVLAELRWRRTLDDQVTEDLGEALDTAAEAAAAEQLHHFFHATRFAQRGADTPAAIGMADAITEPRRATPAPLVERRNARQWRSIGAALEAAEQLAEAPDESLSRQ